MHAGRWLSRLGFRSPPWWLTNLPVPVEKEVLLQAGSSTPSSQPLQWAPTSWVPCCNGCCCCRLKVASARSTQPKAEQTDKSLSLVFFASKSKLPRPLIPNPPPSSPASSPCPLPPSFPLSNQEVHTVTVCHSCSMLPPEHRPK